MTLSVDNGYISTSTIDLGQAGDISLDVRHLSLTNGGQIASASLDPASGKAGSITVNPAASVTISGSSPDNVSPIPTPFNVRDSSSGIFTISEASGAGGDSSNHGHPNRLRPGGKISARSDRIADAGNVWIVGDMLFMLGAHSDVIS